MTIFSRYNFIKIVFLSVAAFFFFASLNAYAGCCFEIDNQGRSFCRNASASSECTSPGNFNPSDDCRDNTCAEAASAAAPQDPSCPPGKFCLQVPFPGSEQVESAVRENILLAYIRTVFQFAIWVAIFLGIFMIMVGGFLYLTSAGSPQRAGRAKDSISNAVLGLLLALFSFLILQTINPRLVDLSIPKIQSPKLSQVGSICCFNRNDKEAPLRRADLPEGDTCKSLETYYGPGWEDCPAKLLEIQSCCSCTTTTAGGYSGSVSKNCTVNKPASECPGYQPFLGGSISCTPYTGLDTCIQKCGIEKLGV